VTPFTTFLYFGVALYVVLPKLALGMSGHFKRSAIVAATLFMLLVQYTGALRLPGEVTGDLAGVLGFGVLQFVIARGLLALPRAARPWAVGPIVVISLLPLLAARHAGGLAGFGFLGISYVTFRALDVILSIHDGAVTSLDPVCFLAFLFFFPTISSGPIDRYRRFHRDWSGPQERGEYLLDLDVGVDRVFRGFLYKFLIAAYIKDHWMKPGFAAHSSALTYMYVYSAYLFFDFAGYSAFAVGLSRVFGVRTPENFEKPFLSRNIKEFWGRWHITLSGWLRDHVYTRFVLAAKRGRWFTGRYMASDLGLLLTMGLMGLWHGTALHYLAYGAYHGVLLVGHDVFARSSLGRKPWASGPVWDTASRLVTAHAVAFGFLIFSGRLF
jgi:membrane protein involved in D-alanine export